MSDACRDRNDYVMVFFRQRSARVELHRHDLYTYMYIDKIIGICIIINVHIHIIYDNTTVCIYSTRCCGSGDKV